MVNCRLDWNVACDFTESLLSELKLAATVPPLPSALEHYPAFRDDCSAREHAFNLETYTAALSVRVETTIATQEDYFRRVFRLSSAEAAKDLADYQLLTAEGKLGEALLRRRLQSTIARTQHAKLLGYACCCEPGKSVVRQYFTFPRQRASSTVPSAWPLRTDFGLSARSPCSTAPRSPHPTTTHIPARDRYSQSPPQ